mmetsp:Transcript_15116/g.47476  ORF Transcript_15116/g.47476 Transcript_15116/m.47476 type:complete len:227 (-) Transcript_15116:513-1193(-)
MRLSLSCPSGWGHSKDKSQLATSVVGTAASGLSSSLSTTRPGSVPRLATAAPASAPPSLPLVSRSRAPPPANTRPTSSTPSLSRSRHSAVTSSRVSSGLPARFSMSGRISYFSSGLGFAKSRKKFFVGSSLNSGRKRLGRGRLAEGSTVRVKLWLSRASSRRCLRSRICTASRKQLLSMKECSWPVFFGFGLLGETLSRLGTTSSALMRSLSFTGCWSNSSTWGAW